MKPVGEHFLEAHDALVALIERLALGDLSEERVRPEALSWAKGPARDSTRLSSAAMDALEYELAARGLAAGNPPAEDASARLTALQALRAALQAAASGDPLGRPVRVEMPPALRARLPKGQGFRMGDVEIIADREERGAGARAWHLAVKHPERFPTWDELNGAKAAVGRDLTFVARMTPGDAGPGPGGFVVHLYEQLRQKGS